VVLSACARRVFGAIWSNAAWPAGAGAAPPDVIWRAGQGAAAFAALAVVATRGQDGMLGHLDQQAIELVQDRRRSAGVAAARAVSTLAEPGVVAALLGACAVPTVRRYGWLAACVPGMVVASGAGARRVLSQVIARPRPPESAWLTEPEGFSLPSKHTTLAALTAGALAGRTATGGGPRHAALLLAAAGVGASRVYLGVHWPTDVLAAWLFAEGWLGLARAATSAEIRPCTRVSSSGPENQRHAKGL
jgi:membrane-associated phospholipid phosphatase